MSAASTHVTEVDLKHDPMFSHPPPWAAVEKIYAAVVHKHEVQCHRLKHFLEKEHLGRRKFVTLWF